MSDRKTNAEPQRNDSSGEHDNADALLRTPDYRAIEERVLGWLASHPDFDIRLLQGRGLSAGEQAFLYRALLAFPTEEALRDSVASGRLEERADGVVTRTVIVAGMPGTVTGRVSQYNPQPHRFPMASRPRGSGV